MSKRKYTKGRQIQSVSDFENSKAQFFIWNGLTRHYSCLQSLQYRTLREAIRRGAIFEAVSTAETQEWTKEN